MSLDRRGICISSALFFYKVNSIVELHGGKVRVQGRQCVSVLGKWRSNRSEQCLKTAQQIEREIDKLLNESGVVGLEPLAVGIGIEQGPVLMGSIGPPIEGRTLCAVKPLVSRSGFRK